MGPTRWLERPPVGTGDHVAFARPQAASPILRESSVSKHPTASASLAKVVSKYRESMAGCPQASLAGISDFLSPVDFGGIFVPIDKAELDDDPAGVFRKMSYLLIAMARLHVLAALRANKESNIHSLAVQMRPALECAGQVVSIFKDLFGKHPGAEARIVAGSVRAIASGSSAAGVFGYSIISMRTAEQ